jgi:hypothetical protein
MLSKVLLDVCKAVTSDRTYHLAAALLVPPAEAPEVPL